MHRARFTLNLLKSGIKFYGSTAVAEFLKPRQLVFSLTWLLKLTGSVTVHWQQHGLVSNKALLPSQTKFINFVNAYVKHFDCTVHAVADSCLAHSALCALVKQKARRFLSYHCINNNNVNNNSNNNNNSHLYSAFSINSQNCFTVFVVKESFTTQL